MLISYLYNDTMRMLALIMHILVYQISYNFKSYVFLESYRDYTGLVSNSSIRMSWISQENLDESIYWEIISSPP